MAVDLHSGRVWACQRAAAACSRDPATSVPSVLSVVQKTRLTRGLAGQISGWKARATGRAVAGCYTPHPPPLSPSRGEGCRAISATQKHKILPSPPQGSLYHTIRSVFSAGPSASRPHAGASDSLASMFSLDGGLPPSNHVSDHAGRACGVLLQTSSGLR